jgi:hypothetical protein
MSDLNYPPGEFASQDGLTVADLVLAPPNQGAGFADILKLSRVTKSRFTSVFVIAGAQTENALDLNNGSSGNVFVGLKLDAGQECAVIIKGGSSGNTFSDVLITRAGGHSDLYLGDYSDQSKAKSVSNHFDHVRRLDDQAVRVSWTFFRAEKPTFTNSQVSYQYLRSFFRTIYVEAKYLLPSLIP